MEILLVVAMVDGKVVLLDEMPVVLKEYT